MIRVIDFPLILLLIHLNPTSTINSKIEPGINNRISNLTQNQNNLPEIVKSSLVGDGTGIKNNTAQNYKENSSENMTTYDNTSHHIYYPDNQREIVEHTQDNQKRKLPNQKRSVKYTKKNKKSTFMRYHANQKENPKHLHNKNIIHSQNNQKKGSKHTHGKNKTSYSQNNQKKGSKHSHDNNTSYSQNNQKKALKHPHDNNVNYSQNNQKNHHHDKNNSIYSQDNLKEYPKHPLNKKYNIYIQNNRKESSKHRQDKNNTIYYQENQKENYKRLHDKSIIISSQDNQKKTPKPNQDKNNTQYIQDTQKEKNNNHNKHNTINSLVTQYGKMSPELQNNHTTLTNTKSYQNSKTDKPEINQTKNTINSSVTQERNFNGRHHNFIPTRNWKVHSLEGPLTFFKLGMQCYIYGHFTLNWFKASEFCHSFGQEVALTVIETRDENKRIKTWLKQNGNNNSGVWIGGSDNGHKGLWAWFPTGYFVDYENWSVSQPSGGDQHCMYMAGGIVGFRWADFNCDFEMNFLCEFETDKEDLW